jgi:hypothetical protein
MISSAGARARGRAKGFAHRLRGQAAEPPDDITLAHKVESVVFRDPRFPKGKISINAEQGEVFLRGQIEMPIRLPARQELEATVAEYHHVQSEHRKAGEEGTVRRRLRSRLARLESHFERLLEESVGDDEVRTAWRRRLHEGAAAPAEPRPPEPPLLFRGRSAAGSVVEIRQRADGDCDVFVDGARLERVAAARDLADDEVPLTFTMGGQQFREIFEVPAPALAAARAYFSDGSGRPPWQHAAVLAADGLVDGTFALTPRGHRALAASASRRI